MATDPGKSPERAASIKKADLIDSHHASEDLKNLLTQLCEEVYFLRMTKKESEERMRHLVTDQHKHERQLEEEILKNSSLKEKQEQQLADLDRSYQEEINHLNREKSKLFWENESWERDVKSVKDEVRSLQLEKYNLERMIREQSHLLKTQTAASDSHLKQAASFEENAKGIKNLVEQCNTQISSLAKEVKEATVLNERLSFINSHHQCAKRDLERKLDGKERVISALKIARKVVDVGDGSGPPKEKHELALLEEQLTQLKSSEDVLKKQLDASRKKNQEILTQLEGTQQLIDGYMTGNEKYKEDAERLKHERDEALGLIGELKEKVKSVEQDVARLQQVKQELEQTYLEKTIKNMEEEICGLKAELGATQAAKKVLQDSSNALQEKYTETLEAMSSLQEQLKQMTKPVVHVGTLTEGSGKEKDTVEKVTAGTNTEERDVPVSVSSSDKSEGSPATLHTEMKGGDLSAIKIDVEPDLGVPGCQPTQTSAKADLDLGFQNKMAEPSCQSSQISTKGSLDLALEKKVIEPSYQASKTSTKGILDLALGQKTIEPSFQTSKTSTKGIFDLAIEPGLGKNSCIASETLELAVDQEIGKTSLSRFRNASLNDNNGVRKLSLEQGLGTGTFNKSELSPIEIQSTTGSISGGSASESTAMQKEWTCGGAKDFGMHSELADVVELENSVFQKPFCDTANVMDATGSVLHDSESIKNSGKSNISLTPYKVGYTDPMPGSRGIGKAKDFLSKGTAVSYSPFAKGIVSTTPTPSILVDESCQSKKLASLDQGNTNASPITPMDTGDDKPIGKHIATHESQKEDKERKMASAAGIMLEQESLLDPTLEVNSNVTDKKTKVSQMEEPQRMDVHHNDDWEKKDVKDLTSVDMEDIRGAPEGNSHGFKVMKDLTSSDCKDKRGGEEGTFHQNSNSNKTNDLNSRGNDDKAKRGPSESTFQETGQTLIDAGSKVQRYETKPSTTMDENKSEIQESKDAPQLDPLSKIATESIKPSQVHAGGDSSMVDASIEGTDAKKQANTGAKSDDGEEVCPRSSLAATQTVLPVLPSSSADVSCEIPKQGSIELGGDRPNHTTISMAGAPLGEGFGVSPTHKLINKILPPSVQSTQNTPGTDPSLRKYCQLSEHRQEKSELMGAAGDRRADQITSKIKDHLDSSASRSPEGVPDTNDDIKAESASRLHPVLLYPPMISSQGFSQRGRSTISQGSKLDSDNGTKIPTSGLTRLCSPPTQSAMVVAHDDPHDGTGKSKAMVEQAKGSISHAASSKSALENVTQGTSVINPDNVVPGSLDISTNEGNRIASQAVSSPLHLKMPSIAYRSSTSLHSTSCALLTSQSQISLTPGISNLAQGKEFNSSSQVQTRVSMSKFSHLYTPGAQAVQPSPVNSQDTQPMVPLLDTVKSPPGKQLFYSPPGSVQKVQLAWSLGESSKNESTLERPDPRRVPTKLLGHAPKVILTRLTNDEIKNKTFVERSDATRGRIKPQTALQVEDEGEGKKGSSLQDASDGKDTAMLTSLPDIEDSEISKQSETKKGVSWTVDNCEETSLKRPRPPHDPEMSLFSEDEDDISSSLTKEIARAQSILNRSRLKRPRRCKASLTEEIGQEE